MLNLEGRQGPIWEYLNSYKSNFGFKIFYILTLIVRGTAEGAIFMESTECSSSDSTGTRVVNCVAMPINLQSGSNARQTESHGGEEVHSGGWWTTGGVCKSLALSLTSL